MGSIEGPLVFFINGEKIQETAADPDQRLSTYIRTKLGLTGTKVACGEAGCGSCTVVLSEYNQNKNMIEHKAINSCLTPLGLVHGKAVTTVEGVGSVATKLHEIQIRLGEFHGSQCGFCTPGFVMSMYALLRANNAPTVKEVDEAIEA